MLAVGATGIAGCTSYRISRLHFEVATDIYLRPSRITILHELQRANPARYAAHRHTGVRRGQCAPIVQSTEETHEKH